MDWANFHFLRPWWFLALVPVVAVAWWYWVGAASNGAGEWRKLVDEKLLPALMAGRTDQRSRRGVVLAVLAGMLAVTALAGPAWKRLPQPLYENRDAMVAVFDMSRSMLATDLKPNRLMRARLKLIDLLRLRKDGETGLVVFAGDAFTVSPLTDDVKTILSLVQDLSVDLMPVQGSKLSVAIKHAVQLLKQAGHRRGSLVILTDGGDGSALAAAAEARKSGYKVSIIGVGTAEGAPAPLPQGGFIQDAQGNVVVHKLDESFLQSVARAGGGLYRHIRVDDGDIRDILKASSHTMTQDNSLKKKELQQDQWREEGPWLLLLLAPLAALAFRRGYILLLVFLLPLPQPVKAADFSQWFRNKDQQGQILLRQGKAEQAAGEFASPDWKASALYKAGKYDEALKLWRKEHSANAYYNSGNALARSGKLKEAIKAYDEAIKMAPDNQDAVKNRELVKKLLKQQQKQQKKNQSSKSGQKSKQQKGEGQKQNQKQGQNQNQKKEHKNGQGQQSEQKQDQNAGKNGEKQQQNKPSQGQKKNQQTAEEKSQQSGKKSDQTKAEKQKADQQKKENADKAAAARKKEQAERKEKQSGKSSEQKNAAQKKLPENREKQGSALDDNADINSPKPAMDRQTRRSLHRIPDDPGGLMRRKFLYQYRQRGGVRGTEGESW